MRELRNRLGWSQEQLAAKCQMAGWDISRSIVAAIEGQVRWVGDFELMLLARVFHVSPGDLFPSTAEVEALARKSVGPLGLLRQPSNSRVWGAHQPR